MRKSELEAALKSKLKLKHPRFVLSKHGQRLSGSVISDTFRNKTDAQRQKMIWDALEAEFERESVHKVGTLLAFTPKEWEFVFESE